MRKYTRDATRRKKNCALSYSRQISFRSRQCWRTLFTISGNERRSCLLWFSAVVDRRRRRRRRVSRPPRGPQKSHSRLATRDSNSITDQTSRLSIHCQSTAVERWERKIGAQTCNGRIRHWRLSVAGLGPGEKNSRDAEAIADGDESFSLNGLPCVDLHLLSTQEAG